MLLQDTHVAIGQQPTPHVLLQSFIGISQAVSVAPLHASNGGCAGPAIDIHIDASDIEKLASSETCVFNTNNDPNFNMIVRSKTDLDGNCIQLSRLNRIEIDGLLNSQFGRFPFLSNRCNEMEIIGVAGGGLGWIKRAVYFA